MIQMAKVSIPDLVIYELKFFSFLDHLSMDPFMFVKASAGRVRALEGMSRLGFMFFLKWMMTL
jgi:hypothetical protein